MHSKTLYLIALSASAAIVSAVPLHFPRPRAVDKLNEEATAEAHQRDDTAERAFSSITINTSNGKCLFVDPLGGDFRANLIPVQIKDCDGSDNEKWDIITKGKHNDQPGTMLVVSALTQGCLNYDPRRQPGDQVNLFSCGGRAAGEGQVTNSQLFNFTTVTSGPLALQPKNEDGTCLTSSGARLDETACNADDQSEFFTFGGSSSSGNGGAGAGAEDTPTSGDCSSSTVATGNLGTGFSTIAAPTTTGAAGGGEAEANPSSTEGFSTIPAPTTTNGGNAEAQPTPAASTTEGFSTIPMPSQFSTSVVGGANGGGVGGGEPTEGFSTIPAPTTTVAAVLLPSGVAEAEATVTVTVTVGGGRLNRTGAKAGKGHKHNHNN
ncbi:hypothetical protein H072_353 [Dactylellina haptotyla CBS 200.50]|uniref:Uncharacterized protein n=1 Tax=Dactylellina haptotyla (strain CBS 200.50) TaxID=1284197 RepID=S8ARZ8_DACHA|nr:hypothetical protein H072_353 [Dactylellina haptotyla CBS 200.50]